MSELLLIASWIFFIFGILGIFKFKSFALFNRARSEGVSGSEKKEGIISGGFLPRTEIPAECIAGHTTN